MPAWDLRTLYVTNDIGNSLTPIDPRTGKPAGAPIPVDDPYNMYFTPDGRYAIVVAERLHRLDFRNAHSFGLHHSLAGAVRRASTTWTSPPTAASCSRVASSRARWSSSTSRRERVVRTIDLPGGRGGMPQDVKLSPDGKIFYVADMRANGVWEIDARSYRVLRFLPTGTGAHGLYPSRDAKLLYVTNRGEGSISVIRFRTRKVVAKWRIPGGGSPDMGGVSADGKVLWLSGRYDAEVYAISTRTRTAARAHPRRLRAARPERLAAARPLLARPHRHPALAVLRTAAGVLAVSLAACGRGRLRRCRDGSDAAYRASAAARSSGSSCAGCHTLSGRDEPAPSAVISSRHT